MKKKRTRARDRIDMGNACCRGKTLGETPNDGGSDRTSDSSKKRRVMKASTSKGKGQGTVKGKTNDEANEKERLKNSRNSLERLRALVGVENAPAVDDQFYDDLKPWWRVARPQPWTGPPPPVIGCEIDVEGMFAKEMSAPRTYRGMPLYPWEGEAWSAPQIFQIIQHGLTCADVNDALGRPCTLKMSVKEQVQHLRNACADVLQSPPFEFALRMFEGADEAPEVAVNRLLARLCEASGGGVYCKLPLLHKTKESCLSHLHDTKHVGAAIYTRIFLLRFCKRFPPQHGFIHPVIDAPETKERVVRDLSDAMSIFRIMHATEKHPAMLFMIITNDSLKNFFSLDLADAWYGVNQAYETAVSEPSEKLSGKVGPMIIDIKGLSVSMLTRTTMAAVAQKMAIAVYHPEPFSEFFLTNSPYLVAALWSIGKLFLTESARKKFVICTGDISPEVRKRYHLDLADWPVEFGGQQTGLVMDASEWLALVPQHNAIMELQKTMMARGQATTLKSPQTIISPTKSKPLKERRTPRSWSTLTVSPRLAFLQKALPPSASWAQLFFRAVELAFIVVLLAFMMSIGLRHARILLLSGGRR